MPQLLKNVRPPINGFQWGTVLQTRPQLAALPMQVIGAWSVIDQMINGMVADLLKLDIVVVTKMLYAIDNISLRRNLVRTAAEHALSSEDNLLFIATLKTTNASEKRRHAFAHHVWATPSGSDHPNSLLLIDPKAFNQKISQWKGEVAFKNIVDSKHSLTALTNWHEDIYMFTEHDFLEDIENSNRAYRVISWVVGLAPGWPDESRNKMRDVLSKEPLIQQEMRRMSEKRCRESQQPQQPQTAPESR